jgi:small subunit ribosomal protein S8
MLTDPIADMLTRIRNAVAVERPHVDVPSSKLKLGLADVLKREGYIWDWKEVAGEPSSQLRLV